MIPRTLPRGRRSGSGIEGLEAAATLAEPSDPGLRLPRDQGDDEENRGDGLRQAAEPALPTSLFSVDGVRGRSLAAVRREEPSGTRSHIFPSHESGRYCFLSVRRFTDEG